MFIIIIQYEFNLLGTNNDDNNCDGRYYTRSKFVTTVNRKIIIFKFCLFNIKIIQINSIINFSEPI